MTGFAADGWPEKRTRAKETPEAPEEMHQATATATALSPREPAERHPENSRGSRLFASSKGWSAVLELSPRECEIARLVARDLSNKEIAGVLEISTWTVATHLRRIFAKLRVHSKAAMVARISEKITARNGTATLESPARQSD